MGWKCVDISPTCLSSPTVSCDSSNQLFKGFKHERDEETPTPRWIYTGLLLQKLKVHLENVCIQTPRVSLNSNTVHFGDWSHRAEHLLSCQYVTVLKQNHFNCVKHVKLTVHMGKLDCHSTDVV